TAVRVRRTAARGPRIRGRSGGQPSRRRPAHRPDGRGRAARPDAGAQRGVRLQPVPVPVAPPEPPGGLAASPPRLGSRVRIPSASLIQAEGRPAEVSLLGAGETEERCNGVLVFLSACFRPAWFSCTEVKCEGPLKVESSRSRHWRPPRRRTGIHPTE